MPVGEHDAILVALRDRMAKPHFDAEFFQLSLCRGGQVFWKGRKQTRPSFDQDDTGGGRIDMAKVPNYCLARQFDDGSGEFDTGRPATDDYEGEQLLA
ncbi:hypothetical protein MesoLjLc_07440 [Mesorhizobium sp. L-8-10]|nr:hypothetical protein MesoLjLc_07440 [Mesorhizobium sp. L-8-10]